MGSSLPLPAAADKPPLAPPCANRHSTPAPGKPGRYTLFRSGPTVFGPDRAVFGSDDAVAAVGESLDASSFVGRVRGYVGNVDGELIFGKRYKDVLYAATASSPVYDAEVHGEIAFFNTPEASPDGGVFGKDFDDLAVLGQAEAAVGDLVEAFHDLYQAEHATG